MKPKPEVPTAQTTAKKPAAFTLDLQEEIRIRAYELYEQRGTKDGHDLDDWLQAESEVNQAAKTIAA
jgi:hypothetical protein